MAPVEIRKADLLEQGNPSLYILKIMLNYQEQNIFVNYRRTLNGMKSHFHLIKI